METIFEWGIIDDKMQVILFYCRIIFQIIMSAKSTCSDTSLQTHNDKGKLSSEDIFKWVNLGVTVILIFCVKGFLEFRAYCEVKGYYVFAVDSLIWVAVGFFFIFVNLSLTSGHQIQLLPLYEKHNVSTRQPKV